MAKNATIIGAGIALTAIIAVIVVFGISMPSSVDDEGVTDTLSRNIEGLDLAKTFDVIELSDGDFFKLEAKPVVKDIDGNMIRMYGYNGQIPGPLLKVKQGSEIFVDFTNNIDLKTTIHWHGLRLDNDSDGVPGITQEPIEPGESFLYSLKFPDDGIYFYHPHIKTGLQMELGLYGTILVEPVSFDYNPVDKEIVLTVDDIKIVDGDVDVFSKDHVNHSLMGRFGNTMFVNGETDYILDVKEGEIVRFYLVNPANTRIFNFSIQEHQLKLIGSDIGRHQRESLVDSVMIAPGERQIIEVLFDSPGAFTILHTTPEKNYILGTINVKASSNSSNEFSFYNLKENEDVVAGFEPFKKYFLKPPDLEINLTLETSMMMEEMEQNDKMMEEMEPGDKMMEEMEPGDKMMEEMEHAIEWEDVMPVMNRMSTNENTKWILRDKDSGKENYDIGYQANVGDVKKFRFFNDPNSAHPMQHPIHLHGQRFIVVSENGNTNDNLVWKDTVLVPAGSTVDILVDFTNPGVWVMHCHILEHAESGMITAITVNS